MVTPRMRTAHFALSHVGCVRTLNEDRCLSNAEAGLFVVADGMGGHDAGEVASTAIVERLEQVTRQGSAIELASGFRDAITAANADIRRYSRLNGDKVIGSTVVGLLVFESDYRCYWSGDSRAYLLRGDTLTQLSRDHTEVQDLLNRGLLTKEEAAVYPRRNVITQAIGVSDYVYMDFTDGHILPGDTFLLCSDGLTGHVSNLEIGEAMAGHKPERICRDLVEVVLDRGGHDNVTICVIQFFAASATVPLSGYPA